MSNNIAGKVVVITGASSGLGEATARLLSAQGASLALARRVDRLRSLENEFNKSGGKTIAVATDVTSSEQVKQLVDAAAQKFGRVDVIINNAGLMPQSQLERLKIDDWDRMIDVNVKGVLYGIAAVLPYMKQQKAGHVIFVSSVAGHKVRPGGVVYSATKHAVRVISEGLRQEVKPYNIRPTVISPGAVATELPNSVTGPDIAEGVKNFYKDVAIPPNRSLRLSPTQWASLKPWTLTKFFSVLRARNIKNVENLSRQRIQVPVNSVLVNVKYYFTSPISPKIKSWHTTAKGGTVSLMIQGAAQ